MARQNPAKKTGGRKVQLTGGDVGGGPHGETPDKNIVISGGGKFSSEGPKSVTIKGGPTGNRSGKVTKASY